MVLWRISNRRTLDGTGGLIVAGRWHTRGRPIVYCSTHPSTCLLEVIVHMELDPEDRPDTFQLLKIVIPQRTSLRKVEPASLPPSWATDVSRTQPIGDRWLASRQTALLNVPSVLAPETSNILLNPLHPGSRLARIDAVFEHPFDSRLFRASAPPPANLPPLR